MSVIKISLLPIVIIDSNSTPLNSFIRQNYNSDLDSNILDRAYDILSETFYNEDVFSHFGIDYNLKTNRFIIDVHMNANVDHAEEIRKLCEKDKFLLDKAILRLSVLNIEEDHIAPIHENIGI
jgi:hypothetical protein